LSSIERVEDEDGAGGGVGVVVGVEVVEIVGARVGIVGEEKTGAGGEELGADPSALLDESEHVTGDMIEVDVEEMGAEVDSNKVEVVGSGSDELDDSDKVTGEEKEENVHNVLACVGTDFALWCVVLGLDTGSNVKRWSSSHLSMRL